ncbi:hypothetical protein GALL_442630 [mine drainage metagenome]|uniref:Uncharacterized protein n=1 Tax=mine drainage metagenome TaxID=410659 RepID=A0A1J5Q2K0_9ZZZZ
MRLVHQCLHFHQQGSRALLGDGNAGPRHLLGMVRQEQGRRVADLAQAFFRHGEHAQFVDGAEAVLESADQSEAGVGIALEIQHGIDDMLQHARACQGAFLGHVADQDDGDAKLFGEAGQLRRTFPHLRHRPRCGLQGLGIDRLDGINHGYVGLVRL